MVKFGTSIGEASRHLPVRTCHQLPEMNHRHGQSLGHSLDRGPAAARSRADIALATVGQVGRRLQGSRNGVKTRVLHRQPRRASPRCTRARRREVVLRRARSRLTPGAAAVRAMPARLLLLYLLLRSSWLTGGARPPGQRRRSAASPGWTGSRGRVGRRGWWRSKRAVSAAGIWPPKTADLDRARVSRGQHRRHRPSSGARSDL